MDRSGGRARHSGDLIAALSGRSPARNLHSDVLWALGLAIVSGTYAEGAILPSDSELLERFGVSRTVLREALKTLAAKGLIEARARIGTRVLPRNRWNLFDADVLAWFFELGPEVSFLRSLAEVRIGMAEHNSTAGLLAVQGVPPGVIMALLEGTESLALGCAAYESAVAGDTGEDDWPASFPFLYHVGRTREVSHDRAFSVMVRAVVDAIMADYERNPQDNVPAAQPA